MKKITREEFESLTAEQQTLLRTLGVNPVESIPKPKNSSGLEEYACVIESFCKLCRGVETKVFLMEGVGNILLSRPATLSEVEGMTIKTREESTLTCPYCHDFLMLMEHEDLVAMTLRVAKGQHRMEVK